METTNQIEISKLSTTLPVLVKNGVKLRQDQSKLIETLFYCYKLVGLTNFPTPGEEKILTDFIIGAYGGLVCEEIPIAFRLAVAGKFEGVEVNCFQNFSPEYFGRIMAAYWKYRQVELAKHQGTLYTPPKIVKSEYYEQCVFVPYDKLMAGEPYPYSVLDGWMLYDEFHKIIATPDEQRAEFKEEAAKMVPKKKRMAPTDPIESDEDHHKRIIKFAKHLAWKDWVQTKAMEGENLRDILTPKQN